MITLKPLLTKILTAISSLNSSVDTLETTVASLAPTIDYNYGSNTSVASGTATTIDDITLNKGTYLLIGAGSFATNATGYRQLHFSYSGGGGFINRFAGTRMAAASGGQTWVQIYYATTISTDGTTIYLVANQNSGSSLTVGSPGIMIVALDGGGITTQ